MSSLPTEFALRRAGTHRYQAAYLLDHQMGPPRPRSPLDETSINKARWENAAKAIPNAFEKSFS